MEYQPYEMTDTNQWVNQNQSARDSCIMAVDVGDGIREIQIHLEMDPHQTAVNFCNENGLINEAVQILELNIYQHLQQLARIKSNLLKPQGQNLSGVDEESSSIYSVHSTKHQQNIFERLHKDAQTKQLRKNMIKAQNVKAKYTQLKTEPKLPYNSGEKLYNQGLQQRQLLQQKIELEIAKKYIQESEHSFRPFISERSQQMVQNKRNSQSITESLIQEGKIMQAKKEIARNERLTQEMQNYTFQPQINIISEKIMEEKNKLNQQGDIHEKLYQEAFIMQAKRYELQQQQVFHMKSNFRTQSQNKNESQVPFLDRMAISIEERQARRNMVKETESDALFDQSTGQDYFRPIVGRPPLNERNSENLPIGDYLYLMKDIRNIRQQELISSQMNELKKSRVKSTQRSNILYETNKKKAIDEIFEMMDSDKDGYISAASVEIQGFSCEVLQILAPLLCEMEQLSASLNQVQFVEATERLIQSLNISDRDKLLNHYKRKNIQKDQPLFKPELNKKSLAIAQMSRSRSDTKIKKAQKIEELKKEREKQELSECSFHPYLFKPMGSYRFLQKQLEEDE